MKYKMIPVREDTHAAFTREQAKYTVERGGLKTSADATLRRLLGLRPRV